MAVNKSLLFERLEVTPHDLKKHPVITHILIKALGNIPAAIECLRTSDQKEALELLRIWDEYTDKEHAAIPFEAFCLSSGTPPRKMLGVIMQSVVENTQLAVELLLAVNHPDIVQKTIDLAKTDKGSEERRVILQNRGTLPTPKNNTFNNYGNMTQDNRKQIANIGVGQLEEDNDDISSGIEEFNAEHIKRIAASENKKVEVEFIDVVDES